jgi:hypothetical protein
MATVKIEGAIYRRDASYMPEPYYMFFTFEASDADTVKVMDYTLEVEVPDDFDPRPGLLANLREQKRAVEAEASAKITVIENKIRNLLAIEHKPREAVS